MHTERVTHSSGVVNGKIYVIGGLSGLLARLSNVEEYNPATDTWTGKKEIPTPREGIAVSAVGGKIYAIGGWANGHSSVVEEYNPATNTWTKKASMPTARSYLSTSVVDGKIYAIGGSSNIPGIAISPMEMYDPETDTWTTKADIPTSRTQLSTSAVNGKIYAIGGAKRNLQAVGPPVAGLSSLEAYDTGFKSVKARGKLPITWGEIKSR